MTWYKWRRSGPDAAPSRSQSAAESVGNSDFVTVDPSVSIPTHIERALITLTGRVETCMARIETLEESMHELTETVLNTPSHGDVLEVRMHSAKLAAELARATVELRGEIGMASDEARRAARLSRSSEPPEVPLSMPADMDSPGSSRIEIDLQSPKAPRPTIDGFRNGTNGSGNGNGNGSGNGDGGSNGNGSGNGKHQGGDGDWSASA